MPTRFRRGFSLGTGFGLGTRRGAFLSGFFRTRIFDSIGHMLVEDGTFLLQENGDRLFL